MNQAGISNTAYPLSKNCPMKYHIQQMNMNTGKNIIRPQSSVLISKNSQMKYDKNILDITKLIVSISKLSKILKFL